MTTTTTTTMPPSAATLENVAMTSEADTLAAIGRFIRETPGAKTLAGAAAIRGLTIEQVAASIRGRPVAVREDRPA